VDQGARSRSVVSSFRSRPSTACAPLLTTKLFVPPPRPDHLSRPRLVSRLEEGMRLGLHLSLLSAPAGYGKTTVLSE